MNLQNPLLLFFIRVEDRCIANACQFPQDMWAEPDSVHDSISKQIFKVGATLFVQAVVF